MAAMKHPLQKEKTHTYLALGDSYTIGENVPAQENFPNQVCQALAADSFIIQSPHIVAKTGWTTDELGEAIKKENTLSHYDLVTLLIGVNNQYRGRTVNDYSPQFESLLQQAIRFAGHDPSHVIVLSIPDWGVTPFALGRDREQIAREIDDYNAANQAIAEQYHVHYINITPGTREAAGNPALVAGDGLHPSGSEYKRWASRIAALVKHIHWQ